MTLDEKYCILLRDTKSTNEIMLNLCTKGINIKSKDFITCLKKFKNIEARYLIIQLEKRKIYNEIIFDLEPRDLLLV